MSLKIKLKFFASADNHASRVAITFQEQIDEWIEENPEIRIKKSHMQSPAGGNGSYDTPCGMVLCVEYYEVSHRDLITEKED
jgi:hypothetical protein